MREQKDYHLTVRIPRSYVDALRTIYPRRGGVSRAIRYIIARHLRGVIAKEQDIRKTSGIKSGAELPASMTEALEDLANAETVTLATED